MHIDLNSHGVLSVDNLEEDSQEYPQYWNQLREIQHKLHKKKILPERLSSTVVEFLKECAEQ